MSAAHDIYAETNPAFCAYILSSFVAAYQSVGEEHAPLAAAYIALPIALSKNLSSSFAGTNKKTGLNTWAQRSPFATLALADRVNATLGITEEAIRFGCFSRILVMHTNASLSSGSNSLKKKQTNELSDEGVRQAFKHAEVLGYWFAKAGSMRTVLDILGVAI